MPVSSAQETYSQDWATCGSCISSRPTHVKLVTKIHTNSQRLSYTSNFSFVFFKLFSCPQEKYCQRECQMWNVASDSCEVLALWRIVRKFVHPSRWKARILKQQEFVVRGWWGYQAGTCSCVKKISHVFLCFKDTKENLVPLLEQFQFGFVTALRCGCHASDGLLESSYLKHYEGCMISGARPPFSKSPAESGEALWPTHSGWFIVFVAGKGHCWGHCCCWAIRLGDDPPLPHW